MDHLDLVTAIASAVSGAAVTGVPLYLKLRRELRGLDRQDRVDSEAEWKRLLDIQAAEINRMTARQTELERGVADSLARHHRCEIDAAELRASVKHLESQLRQLRRPSRGADPGDTSANPFTPPGEQE